MGRRSYCAARSAPGDDYSKDGNARMRVVGDGRCVVVGCGGETSCGVPAAGCPRSPPLDIHAAVLAAAQVHALVLAQMSAPQAPSSRPASAWTLAAPAAFGISWRGTVDQLVTPPSPPRPRPSLRAPPSMFFPKRGHLSQGFRATMSPVLLVAPGEGGQITRYPAAMKPRERDAAPDNSGEWDFDQPPASPSRGTPDPLVDSSQAGALSTSPIGAALHGSRHAGDQLMYDNL